MQEIEELKRQGLSIREIGRLTACDRKTVRKYLNPARSHASLRTTAAGAEQAG